MLKLSVLVSVLATTMLFVACDRIPHDVQTALKKAGKNKVELMKAIRHYKKKQEKLKLEAVYFLIANMEDYYSSESTTLQKYYDLLSGTNQLKVHGIKRDSIDKVIKSKIDSLEMVDGQLNLSEITMKPDLQFISSDFLIKNIDQAFLVWNKPWAKHVSFKDFCEYILPYRIHNEPLSNWRAYFYKELISFEDSVTNPSDPKELILKISNYLYGKWTHLENFKSYGFYPDPVTMEKCNGGSCDYRYFLLISMYRSIGIPVSIDFTPQWTTYTGGHSWNVFLDTDGRMRPFNGAEDNMRFYDKNVIPTGDGTATCTKIYRQTFAGQSKNFTQKSKYKDYPSLFKNRHLLDVTGNYDIPKAKYVLDLKKKHLNRKIIFLGCFNYGPELNFVAWTKVKNGKADFNYIGLPSHYVPVMIDAGKTKIIHNPYVATRDEIYWHYYKPDLTKKDSVRLYRKFSFSGEFIQYAKNMIGSIFQGANNPDFSDAVNLDTIHMQAKAYEEIRIHNPNKFRYLRYLSNDSADVRVAEIEFWGKTEQDPVEKKLQGSVIGKARLVDDENNAVFSNALDGNIRTNFNASPGSWVGFDLGKNNQAQITSIWFLPRNNYNEIEQGHIYELFYLANEEWISLGEQEAQNHFLIYKNVPIEALFVLRDLTEGKQERIFMYNKDNQEQVWW